MKLAATLFALTALWSVVVAAAPPVEVLEGFAPDPQLFEILKETDATVRVRHGYGETELARNPYNPKVFEGEHL